MDNNHVKERFYHLLDSNNNYIIKRRKDWYIYHIMWWFLMPISCIFVSIIFLVIYILSQVDNWDNIPPVIFFIIFVVAFWFSWIYSLIENIKINKVKKFKHNWGWIVRRLKVSNINEHMLSSKGGSTDLYYVEVKDGDKIYYSNAYKKWEIKWISNEELRNIYESYWFQYDENQTKKREVLNEIDRIISEKQREMDNWRWFKKISAEWYLDITKEDREKVESWYIPTYWQVEWNKISVWDMVDVYINPDKPDIYWVDIDFLFEK